MERIFSRFSCRSGDIDHHVITTKEKLAKLLGLDGVCETGSLNWERKGDFFFLNLLLTV